MVVFLVVFLRWCNVYVICYIDDVIVVDFIGWYSIKVWNLVIFVYW